MLYVFTITETQILEFTEQKHAQINSQTLIRDLQIDYDVKFHFLRFAAVALITRRGPELQTSPALLHPCDPFQLVNSHIREHSTQASWQKSKTEMSRRNYDCSRVFVWSVRRRYC